MTPQPNFLNKIHRSERRHNKWVEKMEEENDKKWSFSRFVKGLYIPVYERSLIKSLKKLGLKKKFLRPIAVGNGMEIVCHGYLSKMIDFNQEVTLNDIEDAKKSDLYQPDGPFGYIRAVDEERVESVIEFLKQNPHLKFYDSFSAYNQERQKERIVPVHFELVRH